jgi:hypothetical protein
MDYPNLVSLAIIAQGQKDHVCSLVNSLLQNTPTCSVMLGDDYETALIISRIPEESIQDITSLLPRVALENNIQLRCLVPRAFRSFQSAIHQRLLKDDNTWDDDVSAFLSQARSKRKELSESNA